MNQEPVLIQYQGPSFALSWAIYVYAYQTDQILSVALSTNGAIIIAQLTADIVLIDAATGTGTDRSIPGTPAVFSVNMVRPSFAHSVKTLIMNGAGKMIFSG